MIGVHQISLNIKEKYQKVEREESYNKIDNKNLKRKFLLAMND